MGGIVFALLTGFLLGGWLVPRYVEGWLRWKVPDFARSLWGARAILLMALLAWPAIACAQIQSIDTLWRHDSTAVVDSTRTVARVDTFYTPWQVDTTWRRDSTIARIDTVFAPPPPLAGACPNEPKGWTLLSARPFVPLATPVTYPNGTMKDPGWVTTGAFALVQDPTAPDGDGYIGRATYAQGRIAGSGTFSSWYVNSLRGKGYRSLYTCYAQRVPTDYVGEWSSVNKWGWVQMGTGSENRVFSEVSIPTPAGATWTPTSTFTAYASFRVQALDNVGSSTAQRNMGMPMSRGVWHWIEMRVDLESAKGAADGSVAMWMDGKPTRTLSGLRFTHPGEALELSGTKLNNIWGGGNGQVCPTATPATHPECFVPHTQSIDVDAQRVLVH